MLKCIIVCRYYLFTCELLLQGMLFSINILSTILHFFFTWCAWERVCLRVSPLRSIEGDMFVSMLQYSWMCPQYLLTITRVGLWRERFVFRPATQLRTIEIWTAYRRTLADCWPAIWRQCILLEMVNCIASVSVPLDPRKLTLMECLVCKSIIVQAWLLLPKYSGLHLYI